MRFSTLAMFSAVCLLALGCNSTSNDPGSLANGSGPAATAVDDLEVGQPIQVENLTVFPVTSKTPRDADRFITLDEGLKAGTVEILEVGGTDGGPNAQTLDLPEDDGLPVLPQPFDAQPQLPQEDQLLRDAEADAAARSTEPARPAGQLGDPFATAPAENGGALIRASDFEGLAPASEAAPESEVDLPDPDEVVPPDNSAPNPDSTTNAPQQLDAASTEQGWLQLNNLSSGNDVNKLIVVNHSDRPLYLMPGEIIVGGSQDRTIGQELVIAPDGKPTPIDVFCVERHRWGGREGDANQALLAAATMNENNAQSVALSAEVLNSINGANPVPEGKFVASVGNVNAKTRQTLQQSADQGRVWDEVARNNAKSGVQVESGAFTHNYVDAEAVKRFDPFIEKLQAPIADTKQVVGVIVAIDGKVQSIDVFESTPLFRKLWPKLLKSYALDAVTAGETGGKGEKVEEVEKGKKTCTQAEAVAFFNEAAKAGVNRSEEKEGVMLVHRDSERVVTFSASESAAAADLSSDFGGAIHASAFAK